MSLPLNHHFAPRFYLAEWHGADGKLRHYSWANGHIVVGTVNAKYAGFEKGLYSFAGLAPEKAQYIETEFFTKVIDDPAAPVHQLFINPDSPVLTDEQRRAWARFVSSLRVRTPGAVQRLREYAAEVLTEALRADGEYYNTQRNIGDPATFQEWVDMKLKCMNENFGILAMPTVVARDETLNKLLSMSWLIRDLRAASVSLLTSDRPLFCSGGIDDTECLLALPVSPTKVFLAAHSTALLNRIAAETPTSLAKMLNDTRACQAEKYVYATDESH